MLSQNPLQLETEIERVARAMMTRNREVGADIISYLRKELTLQELAGLTIVTIERVIWFDIESVLWTIEHLISEDIMQEMKKIVTLAIYQRLISKQFVPGTDFSVDACGKLLLSDRAKTAVLCR